MLFWESFGLCRLRLDKVPQPIETGQILARWCSSNDQYTSVLARRIVASILTSVRERDGRWVALAKDQFGLSDRFLWDNIAFGDNSVLLAILIHMARQATLTNPQSIEVLSSLSNFETYTIRFLDFSTNFVLCGIKSFWKRGTKGFTAILFSFSARFAMLSSPYIKAVMHLRLRSLLLPLLATPFLPTHRRIPCATSPLITPIRPLAPHLTYQFSYCLSSHLTF